MPSSSPCHTEPAPAAHAHGHGMGGVSLLAWAHFLNDGAANFLPGILPMLLVSLALPIRYAGILVGLLIVGQALQPFVGILGDRGAGRALIVAGLAGSSLGAAWIGWTTSAGALIAALVLIGICNSLFHPPALATVRRLASDGGERATALFLVGGEIGRGLWPLLASFVVVAWGLHSLWILSLAALPTLPLLALRVRVPASTQAHTPAWQGVRDAGRPLRVLIAYSCLRGALIVGVSAFVPLLWQARGKSLVFGAGLITAMLVTGIIGNLGAAELARRWGRRRLVIVSTLLYCLLLAAAILLHGLGLWLAMAGFGVALFATLPLTVLMVQDLMPRQHSFGSGLALGFSNAMGAVLVALLGLLLASTWGAQGVLWALEACALLSLLLSFRLTGVPSPLA